MVGEHHGIGLALSGGGVRGAAHVGLLRVLEERSLEPTALSGTSSGALVAAMYAAGQPLDRILDVIRDSPFFSWSHLGIMTKPGLFDCDRLLEVLDETFQDCTFADLDRELAIVATDLLSGGAWYFREGSVALAVLASSAYPGVVSPVDHEGLVLADGGIVNNLPIEPLLDRCELLIGSYVNPIDEVRREDLKTTLAVTQRAFHIATGNAMVAKLERCSAFMAPTALLDIGLFESDKTDEAYRIGYEAAAPVADAIADARLGGAPVSRRT